MHVLLLQVGVLIGLKTLVNEFAAYGRMQEYEGVITERSKVNTLYVYRIRVQGVLRSAAICEPPATSFLFCRVLGVSGGVGSLFIPIVGVAAI